MYKKSLIAALLAVGVVGCGGGGGGSTPTNPGKITGGTTVVPVKTISSAPTTVAPIGTATSIAITVPGNPIATVAVVGGETVTKNDQVFLIPKLLPISFRTKPSGANVKQPRQSGRTAGEFYTVTGTAPDQVYADTGLSVNSSYQLQASGQTNHQFDYYAYSFPNSGSSRKVTLFCQGPLTIGSGSNILDISEGLTLTFELSNDADLGPGTVSTYPAETTYTLPANGQSTFNASFSVHYTPSIPSGITIPTQMIVKSTAWTKTQPRAGAGSTFTLFDGNKSTNDQVPGSGITSASLTIANP